MIKVEIKSSTLQKIQRAFNPNKVEKGIQNGLISLAKGARVDFDVTTQTWSNRPEFKITNKGADFSEVFTDDDVYRYLNDGTTRHPIVAVNAPNLVFFRKGFRPKTRVGYIGSNKGSKANKDLFVGKMVDHPGNEARNWDKEIADKWKKRAPKIMSDNIRSALRS